jgi:3-oxoacyl-[acyl-carrier protein] reductase
MSSHAGRVAVVTGAGRGIGRAVANALAAAGASVAYLDTDAELAAAAAAAAHARGHTSTARQTDVSDEVAVNAAFAAVAEAIGPIGILVNNAGISPKAAPRACMRRRRPSALMNGAACWT